jgi:hypothetical protein
VVLARQTAIGCGGFIVRAALGSFVLSALTDIPQRFICALARPALHSK